MSDNARERTLRALDAIAASGWTVARDRAELVETEDDTYPMVAIVHDSLDEAFDAGGDLADPLRLVRNGPGADLQVAFAREGVCVELSLDDDEEDFAVDPRLWSVGTDLMMLLEALDELRSQGFAIGAGIGDTPSDAWEQLDDEAGGRAEDAVMWTREAHRAAFDRVGKLTGALHLGWRGDRSAITAAFEDTVFDVEEPVDEDDTFAITT